MRAEPPESAGCCRLSEEIRKGSVIEQILRPDDFCLPESRRLGDAPVVVLRIDWRPVGRRRWMALPARVANALDLAIDPQFVHDVPESFGAGVGQKCAQIRRLIAAVRFHSIEDEPGLFAQGMHDDSRTGTRQREPGI